MYQNVSLQIVQSIEFATAHFAIVLLVGIVILLVHAQVGHMLEGLLAYVARIRTLLVRHVRFLVLGQTRLIHKSSAAIDAGKRSRLRVVQRQVTTQRRGCWEVLVAFQALERPVAGVRLSVTSQGRLVWIPDRNRKKRLTPSENN